MHKCTTEQHNKCENSSICCLCDSTSLYKNTREEQAKKLEAREQRKQDEKNTAFRTHKAERKEGMAFEKAVQNKWNAAFNLNTDNSGPVFKQSGKKTKIQKPRIGVEEEPKMQEPVIKQTPAPSITLSGLSAAPIKKRPVMDAKRQVNSGAMWHSKGDIITQDYLMECKERGTVNARGEKTISIPKDWLEKQAKEAFQEQRSYWLLPFRYKNDEEIYVVKPLDHEIELYQEIRRLREENEALTSMNKV